MPLFRNQIEAAHELARSLSYLKDQKPIILGMANGGVQLAEVIALALDAPMDVLLIERLRAPQAKEHIVGAVDEHGRISMIQSTARWHHLTSQQMIDPAREAYRELQRLRARLRAVMPELDVQGRTVVIVSQGIATGAKMLGAVASVRDRGASKVIVAAPAGATKATWQLHETADVVVIPHRPAAFKSVDRFYQEFIQVTEDMVMNIVERWVASRPQQQPGVKTIVMRVPNDAGTMIWSEVDLPPDLERGSGPYPAVIFAHDMHSDGRSPRAVPISFRLAKRNIIGVRMDFSGHGRSEGTIEQSDEARMLSDLATVLENVRNLNEVNNEQIGLCGAGTGGALALRLAATCKDLAALVVRSPIFGNSPIPYGDITAATLLIHAALDLDLCTASERAAEQISGTHEMLTIPESDRLFRDPISRELMVSASVDWLVDHVVTAQVVRGESAQETADSSQSE